MFIKGLDHGYLYTKDSDRNIFRSAYSRSNTSLSDRNRIIIDGEKYYYGMGNTTADVDKIDSFVNKVCTLAILGMSQDDECCLVVDLPLSQYEEKKDKFRSTIMDYNNCEVTFNNCTFKPRIKDVTVFAQGAASLFNIGIPDGEYISFDIGSYTINIALIELKNGITFITKFDTWYDGVLTLYAKMIAEVNKRFDLTLDIEYAEKIFKNGLHVHGEKQDITFLKLISVDYLENIFSKFKPNYPYATTPIILSGGGANLLGGVIGNYFNNSITLPDGQFSNAIGCYNFGLQKYGHLLERRCNYV